MQIAGNDVDPSTSVDDIIAQLKPHRAFPLGARYFPERNANDVFMDLLTGKRFLDGPELQTLIEHHLNQPFERAANKYEYIQNLVSISSIFQTMIDGKEQGALAFSKSLDALIKAYDCAAALGDSYSMHQTSGFLYLTLHSHLSKFRKALGEDDFARLTDMKRKCLEINVHTQGLYGDAQTVHDAWAVEQREIGFSSDAPIGTKDLQQCVGVIVRDPVTCKVAVTHIDLAADVKSLSEIFKRMPQHAQPPLEVRLVGARIQPNEAAIMHNDHLKMLEANHATVLKNILGELKKRNVNILSADVLEYNQPAEFVVFPGSGEIRFAVPGKPNPNHTLALGKPLSDGAGVLQVAFDLSVCKERSPVLISRNMIGNLAGGNLEPILERQMGYFPSIPSWAESLRMLHRTYKDEIEEVCQKFERAAEAHDFPRDKRTEVREVLRKTPIFVGHNADICNKPLYELIEDKLWTAEKGKGKPGKKSAYAFDLRGLRNFNFSPAYKYIETEFGQGFQSNLGRETPGQQRTQN